MIVNLSIAGADELASTIKSSNRVKVLLVVVLVSTPEVVQVPISVQFEPSPNLKWPA